MGLAQAIPILGYQGRSIKEHPRVVLGGSAGHIGDIGVDAIAVKVYRARGLGHHKRGRGESDHRVDGSQRAGLGRVEDIHLRRLGNCMRLRRVGRCHEGIPHHDTSIV